MVGRDGELGWPPRRIVLLSARLVEDHASASKCRRGEFVTAGERGRLVDQVQIPEQHGPIWIAWQSRGSSELIHCWYEFVSLRIRIDIAYFQRGMWNCLAFGRDTSRKFVVLRDDQIRCPALAPGHQVGEDDTWQESGRDAASNQLAASDRVGEARILSHLGTRVNLANMRTDRK